MLCLFLAEAFGLFANGKWVIPIAAWVAPVFMLRFLSICPGWRGFALYFLASYPVAALTAHGLIPLPDRMFFPAIGLFLLVGYVPFWLHLNSLHRISGLIATFAYPSVVVTLEYVGSFGDFGTWGSLALPQGRRPPGEPTLPGVGNIPTASTTLGRLASVICFDADFPSYTRRLGQEGVDILLVPSNDWQEAASPHLAVSAFRSVENGFSMVRPARGGISVVLDYLGRPRGELDYFRARLPRLVATVPIEGVSTIYSVIGDLFAWLSITTCLGLLLLAVVHRPPKEGQIV